jgi:hypothetical protein
MSKDGASDPDISLRLDAFMDFNSPHPVGRGLEIAASDLDVSKSAPFV